MQILALLRSKFSMVMIWMLLITNGSPFSVLDEFSKLQGDKDFEIDFPSKNLITKTTYKKMEQTSHSKTSDFMITNKDEVIYDVEKMNQHPIKKLYLNPQSKHSTQELDKDLNLSKLKISMPHKKSHPKNNSPKIALKDNMKYFKREAISKVPSRNSSIDSNTTKGNYKKMAAALSSDSKPTTKKASSESFTNSRKSIVETTVMISKPLVNVSNTKIITNLGVKETSKMGSKASDGTTRKLPITPLGKTVNGHKVGTTRLTSQPANSISLHLGINPTQMNTSQHNESKDNPNSDATSNGSNDVIKDGTQTFREITGKTSGFESGLSPTMSTVSRASNAWPLAFGNRSTIVQLHSVFFGFRGNNVALNVSYDGNSKNVNRVVNVMTNSSTTLNQKSTQTTGYDFIIFPRR